LANIGHLKRAALGAAKKIGLCSKPMLHAKLRKPQLLTQSVTVFSLLTKTNLTYNHNVTNDKVQMQIM